jgi:nitrogen fixation/metabolism regulation signal transduction histidine kinase
MKNSRKKKYIEPALQNHLIRSFLLATATALVLQYIVFASLASRIAREMPNDGAVFMDQLGTILMLALGGTLILVLPTTFLMGLTITHKVAGPVYRLSMYLREVRDGGKPKDARLRKGDQLHDLCRLVNEATAPLREGEATSTPGDAAARDRSDEAA